MSRLLKNGLKLYPNNMSELENIKLFFANAVVKDCVSIKKVEISGMLKYYEIAIK